MSCEPCDTSRVLTEKKLREQRKLRKLMNIRRDSVHIQDFRRSLRNNFVKGKELPPREELRLRNKRRRRKIINARRKQKFNRI